MKYSVGGAHDLNGGAEITPADVPEAVAVQWASVGIAEPLDAEARAVVAAFAASKPDVSGEIEPTPEAKPDPDPAPTVDPDAAKKAERAAKARAKRAAKKAAEGGAEAAE
jgi:hypothetical protein